MGAALALTDAALGSAVMSDRRVSYRVRQTLNGESGLNDGIVTPIVTVSIAAIAAEAGIWQQSLRGLFGLLLGALTGVVLGALGGVLLRSARRRGWSSAESAGPGILALASSRSSSQCWSTQTVFVAAFVAGSAFGALTRRGRRKGGLLHRADLRLGIDDLLASFGAIGVRP